MKRWKGDAPRPEKGASFEDRWIYDSQRRQNYIYRMLPHVCGIFPYVGMWVIIINSFMQQLNDVRIEHEDLYARMPSWIVVAVVGSAIIFSLFTVPQVYYQWLPPMHYWQTELWYCFLSATAKVYLGGLLYVNVVVAGSFEDSLILNATDISPPPSPPPDVRM